VLEAVQQRLTKTRWRCAKGARQLSGLDHYAPNLVGRVSNQGMPGGHDDPGVLVWKAPTRTMNATVPQSV
jgi:hypothetical protein